MTVKNAFVNSRTVERDYYWVPKLPDEIRRITNILGYDNDGWCGKACGTFKLTQQPSGVFVMTHRIPTAKQDHVRRPITDSALIKVGSIDDALRVYDARKELLLWTESFFESDGSCGTAELDRILEATAATSTLDLFRQLTREELVFYQAPNES